jgi:hypothetical protein
MFRCIVSRLARAVFFGLFLVLAVPAQAGPTPPAAPVKTIVVFGDSQAQGVAAALQRMFLRDRSYHVIDKAVAGTALSQKLQYDWVDSIDKWLAAEHADVAILMFGGNDRLAVRLEAGGKAIAYKSDAWKAMYNERLAGVLGLFATAKVPVIWLGQPIARESGYATDMSFLNELYAAATKTAGADYLPLWTVIADDDGNYAAYGKALDGETKRLRLDDGIHFTPAGYDIVAVKVREQIDALLAKPADAPPADAAPAPADPAPAKPTLAKPAMPTETAAAPAEKAETVAPAAPSAGPAPPHPTPSVADSSAHS